MKVVIVFLMTTIFLSSCSTSQSKGKVNKDFIDGNSQGLKLKSVKDGLRRVGGPLAYVFSVTPTTPALIRIQETEMGKKNLSSQSEIDQSISKKLNELAEGKTCFEVYIVETNGNGYGVDVGSFKNWKARIENENKVYDGVFKNLGPSEAVVQSGVSATLIGTSPLLQSRKQNTSVMCTETKLNLNSKVKLNFIPQFGDGQMPSVVLEWE